MDQQRFDRLTKFFNYVTLAKSLPVMSQKDLFLEAICAQQNARRCISDLIANRVALDYLGAAVQSDLNIYFLNGHATKLLKQKAVSEVDKGGYLEQVLLVIVDRPIFWSAFVDAYKAKKLEAGGPSTSLLSL